MPKILKFKYGFSGNHLDNDNCLATFVVPDSDNQSKDFILEKINSILTDDEGGFKIQSFSIEVSEAVNFFSDMVSMSKATEKLMEKTERWKKE